MYLSKVSFKSQHWQSMVKTLQQGLYHEHQLLWRWMPENKDAERDFLYRREDEGALPFFYVLSAREPMVDEALFICQSRPFEPQLQVGDELVFKLRANAVKSYKQADSNKRRRVDIVKAHSLQYADLPAAEQPPLAQIRYEAGWAWLQAQGAKGGFELLQLGVENHQLHRFRKAEHKGAEQMFASMDFAGTLCVTDATLFVQQTLLQGLGRSKAFGCGLLLVKRV